VNHETGEQQVVDVRAAFFLLHRANFGERFLQISMDLMAHDEKAIDIVQKNNPVIRNNLLLLMSNRNYQSLMSREGKEKLRQEALTEIRAVQKKEGSPDVDDLLFTSFVVQ